MNKELIAFLKGIGVSQETIDAVSKEEKPEDFDVNKYVDMYQSTQEKLFENKHKDRIIDQADLDKKFDVLRGTLAAKLNKQFDLGFTRKEVESMKFEDVLEKAHEHLQSKIDEAANQTDSELVKKNKLLQESLAAAKGELDDYKDNFDLEVGKIKEEYESKLNNVLVDKMLDEEHEQYEWPIAPELIPVIKEKINNTIKSNFKVFPDKKIEGIDGTHAQAFDGKGIYKDVSEALRDLRVKYNSIAKNKIVNDKDTPISTLVANPEKLSQAAQNILNAATANGK